MTPQEKALDARLKEAQLKERKCASDLRDAQEHTRSIIKELQVLRKHYELKEKQHEEP